MFFTKRPTRCHLRLLCCSALMVLFTACGGTDEHRDNTAHGLPLPDAEAPEVECSTPNHLALTDVESVTDWINALPKPLELPCFIASLPRPFYVNMTQSLFSAQPSDGAGNPRIFIFYERLIMSVVPQENFAGVEPEQQHNLLEISFNTKGVISIKAEIAFPVYEPLSYGDAYSRAITHYATSSCGVCHANEEQVGEFDTVPVYQSKMLRPYDDAEVTITRLKDEALVCDPAVSAHRCNMLNALVGNGDIVWQDFARDIPIL